MTKETDYWISEAQTTFRVVKAMVKATEVLGDRELAWTWMHRPARGLNRQKPIDLVLRKDGLDAVLTYLEQIKYGVYV
ncbi:putative toxin-antitoxin system antitoxin component (TIGR02293 family) [Pseudomonas sp. GV071]|nr:putative toxin-antitoxin system antitoxin component (TIGR02293 family) [Pseudomonas sp. GV071]